MRKITKGCITVLFLIFPFSLANACEPEGDNALMLIDLKNGDTVKLLDVWTYNILDSEQSIKAEIMEYVLLENMNGKAIRLEFDVESSRSAMVGLWINLQNKNLSDYDFLHINLRSQKGVVFSGNVALQFKDESNRKSSYLISGISEDWKEHRVPLRRFSKIADWSKVKEFEIIIDDINARPKEGVLFIDKIYVSSSKRSEVYEC